MSEPDDQPRSFVGAFEQSLALQGLCYRQITDLGKLGCAYGFAERHHLQQVTLGGIQSLEPRLDQLDEAIRRVKLAHDPPQTTFVTQHPLSDGATNQLAQKQHV